MSKGSNNKRTQEDKPDESVSRMMKIACAEFLGTTFLLFLGCVGCTTGLSPPPHSHLKPALVFGFAVASIIQMFGHISAAHLNPAISLAAVFLKVISWKLALVYTAAQCLGAIVGYGLLKLITPSNVLNEDAVNGFCTTVPNAELGDIRAFIAEFLATAVLIFVLCGSWDRRNAHNSDSVAIKFGLVIAALALAIGPYTGASMNPARSLGPAFWNGIWTSHWIYWVAPLSSAAVVSIFYRTVLDEPERKPTSTELRLTQADDNGTSDV